MSNATDNPKIEVLKAGGSGVFTNYIYKAIPLAFDESMSYYETLAGLRDYLEETVIPTVNNNAEAVAELQGLYEELNKYVDDYFKNLDVQEEINNKLDDLVADGTLTNLISTYVQPLIDEQNQEISEFKTSVNNQIAGQNAQIQAVESGSPLVASSVAGMTDTTRVYVNTTDGNWYYYNGSQWTIGGVYQSTGIGYKQITSDKLNNLLARGINVNELPINYNTLTLDQFEWELGYYNADTGLPVDSNSSVRTTDFIDFDGQAIVGIVFRDKGRKFRISKYSSDGTYIGNIDATDAPISYKKTLGEKIKLSIVSQDGTLFVNDIYNASQSVIILTIKDTDDVIDYYKKFINKNSLLLFNNEYKKIELGTSEPGAFNLNGTPMDLNGYYRSGYLLLDENNAKGKYLIINDLALQSQKRKSITAFLYDSNDITKAAVKKLSYTDFRVDNNLLSYKIDEDCKYMRIITKAELLDNARRYSAYDLGIYIVDDNTFIKKDRPTNGIVHFTNRINTNFPTNEDSLTIQDDETIYTDNAILFLPTNYKPLGKPTQLIINCHGSGTHITSNSSVLSEPVPTLIKMGYAVLDCNGIPEEISNNSGLHYGSPIALQCYLKAYQYAIENYNLTESVFVVGTSMGGLTSNMLVQSGSIPVIAQAGFCPVTDHFKQAWCNPWQSGQRQRIATLFNFTGEAPTFTATGYPTPQEIQYYKDNIDKVIGYNPMMKYTVNWNSTYLDNYNNTAEANDYNSLIKYHSVPLKIWHNDNDITVYPRYSEYFINSIKQDGGLAILRKFPSGGHNAWDNGDTITIQDIDGNDLTIKASQYELLLWFKRFQ